MADCGAGQSSEPPQPSSKMSCSDASQPESRRHGNRVVERQRKTASARDDNKCSLLDVTCTNIDDVTCTRTDDVIHKRGDVVQTRARSAQLRLPARIYENVELDVLLTPQSERRQSLYVRRHHIVDSVSLDSAMTPENSRLTPKAAEISSRCTSVLPRISTNGKLSNGRVRVAPTHVSKSDKVLNDNVVLVPLSVLRNGKPLKGIVEEDEIESALPQSEAVSGSCSLIPIEYLSFKNGFVEDDDAEIDVCVRSFWDEGSDPETDGNFNFSFNFGSEQVSDDRKGGSRLKKTLKFAANRQTSSAKKRRIAKAMKTTVSRQHTLKIMPSGTGHKNLIKPQRKAESNPYKLSSNDQKGSKAARSSALRCCTMTLRAPKDVDYVGIINRKQRLSSQQKKTSAAHNPKEKTKSSRIQRKMNNTGRRPRRQMCTAASSCHAVQPVATRTRGRSHSKNPSPLMSPRASVQQGKPNGQTGRKYKRDEKRGQTSRKRIRSDTFTKSPAKQQKLCKKARVAGEQQANVRQAASLNVIRKQSKAAHSRNPKKNASVTQSVNEREAAKQESRTSKVTSAQQTEDTETVSADSLTSGKTNSAGDVVSSSINSKKTRSVDNVLLSNIIFLFFCCST